MQYTHVHYSFKKEMIFYLLAFWMYWNWKKKLLIISGKTCQIVRLTSRQIEKCNQVRFSAFFWSIILCITHYTVKIAEIFSEMVNSKSIMRGLDLIGTVPEPHHTKCFARIRVPYPIKTKMSCGDTCWLGIARRNFCRCLYYTCCALYFHCRFWKRNVGRWKERPLKK